MSEGAKCQIKLTTNLVKEKFHWRSVVHIKRVKPVPLEVDDVDEDKLGQGVYVPVPKEFRDQLVGLSVDKLIDDISGLRRVAEVQVLDVGVKVLLTSLLEILFESKIC